MTRYKKHTINGDDMKHDWYSVETFLKLFGRLPKQNAPKGTEDRWTLKQLCREYVRRLEKADYDIISNKYGEISPTEIYEWCCGIVNKKSIFKTKEPPK
jgi:hypothetical protein